MQLITWCEPNNVMLVHGEGDKMKFLKNKIKQEHGIDRYAQQAGAGGAARRDGPGAAEDGRVQRRRAEGQQRHSSGEEESCVVNNEHEGNVTGDFVM